MIFQAPDFLPTLPAPLPLQQPTGDLVVAANIAIANGSEKSEARNAFVDAATSQEWTAAKMDAHVATVAAALCAAWQITPGQQWNKVVALLSSNSVESLILTWAVHRLGGACLMLQPTSSAEEIASHLDHVSPWALFASEELLPLAQLAAQGTPAASKLLHYKLSVAGQTSPEQAVGGAENTVKLTTLDDLIVAAKDAPVPPRRVLAGNEASHRVAYYCTTSGTGGIQRIVAITHKNMIASVLQAGEFYKATREKIHEVNLGFLPFNHIYGLLITHTLLYLGDSIVIHRGFNLIEIMMSIQKYKINGLFLVPPIINALSRNAAILDKFDLSSVKSITSGGGPLSTEDFEKMHAARPDWRILSGWGQTEGCGIGTLSPPGDIFPGSSGVLLPGVKIRLRDEEHGEIDAPEQMGEIEIASPSILHGYIDRANDSYLHSQGDAEFWWPTGDVGLFRRSPSGELHLFVVDRIRDMIKVKGNQVAPGQIEAHLSKHEAVAEAAVIGVRDDVAGERPLAFIVRMPKYANGNETELRKAVQEYNDLNLPEVCRLHGRIIFVDSIPKSASGKVLKRELRKQIQS